MTITELWKEYEADARRSGLNLKDADAEVVFYAGALCTVNEMAKVIVDTAGEDFSPETAGKLIGPMLDNLFAKMESVRHEVKARCDSALAEPKPRK
jgi:hypothetical protein